MLIFLASLDNYWILEGLEEDLNSLLLPKFYIRDVKNVNIYERYIDKNIIQDLKDEEAKELLTLYGISNSISKYMIEFRNKPYNRRMSYLNH